MKKEPISGKIQAGLPLRQMPFGEMEINMASATTYREQYDRMMRWYERCRAIDQGRPHDTPSDNYLDEIYAFFLNCYHLKDWIRQDSTVAAQIQQSVENHINSHRSLRLCADICNSLKHLRLTKKPRSGESPAFGKKEFALNLGTSTPPTISLKYEIETSSGPIDAFSLATDCVKVWDTFLQSHGL